MRGLFISAALAAIFITLFRSSKKQQESSEGYDTNARALDQAFRFALTKYPAAIVQNAERIYQQRSNHYQRMSVIATGGAVMEAFGSAYPWGWNSLTNFWAANPQYKPIGITTDYNHESTSKLPLIVFPDLKAGVITLCQFLQDHNNNAGRWVSLIPAEQVLYNQMLQSYVPVYSA